MPRRLNYTGRKKINRGDAIIRLNQTGEMLNFDVDLRLAEYKLDQGTSPPRVYIEAYRGASTLWKRFDFGRVGTIQPPADRSLTEFGVPQGIRFRVKISGEGEALGKLLAEADGIRPRMPGENEEHGEPLIEHMPAEDIGDELWRVDFTGDMPLLKINKRVPMGVDQFLLDPQYRALFAPAVMRQVLARILIVDRDTGDEENDADWRVRWLRYSSQICGAGEFPEPDANDGGGLSNLQQIEEWIDKAVETFVVRTGLFAHFVPTAQENKS